MSFEAPLEPLLYSRWRGAIDRLVAHSVQHVVELLKHLCRVLRYLVHAIESLVRVNRVCGLQSNASLFESEGEQSDGLGDAVDFEAFSGYFAADSIQDE